MKEILKKGFTLVEMMVVITILGILGTIAFISFWGLMWGVRDSTRTSDIANMKIVLEKYAAQRGVFPNPSNWANFTYSWGVVFTQGTFWKSLQVATHWEIGKIPIDPLYKNEYNYSVGFGNNSYNLWFVQEWQLAYSPILWEWAYAAEVSSRELVWRVDWNYNGQIMYTFTWGQVYVFALPSLLTNKWEAWEVLGLTDKLLFNNEFNIPASYSWKVIQVGQFDYEPKLVYSWSTLPRSPAQLKRLVTNLKWAIQNAGHPTPLFSRKEFNNIVELDVNNPNDLYDYGQEYINTGLWWRFKLKYPKSCKEILWTSDDLGSKEYTISPNGHDKIDVYCDMSDTFWWGWWTRIRRRKKGVWYTDIKTVNDTRWFLGSELMVVYTRAWAVNIGKKFGLYYETFKVKQYQSDVNGGADVFCWEHTTISDLISQVTSGARWDCSRSWWTANEYIDIIVDDLWDDAVNSALIDNKKWVWFTKDPCISTGHKDTARNVSWTSNGAIQHRIDNTTALFSLWWAWNRRCLWTNTADQEVLTNELYIR